MRVNPRFYRPAEVELLIGNPGEGEARARLGGEDHAGGAVPDDGRGRPDPQCARGVVLKVSLMRLSKPAPEVIKETASRPFGPGVEVWLFGSRVQDSARGGDVDLLVVLNRPLVSQAKTTAEFPAEQQWQLVDQRIDVVMDDRSQAIPITARDRETGEGLR